jgi:hypothetical protein
MTCQDAFASFPVLSERTKYDSFGTFLSFKKIRACSVPAKGLANLLARMEYPAVEGVCMGTGGDSAFIYRMQLTYETKPMVKLAQ